MRILAAAGLAGALLATTPLYAADLFGSAPPPMEAPAVDNELGTNWYIRGDIGYGQLDQDTVTPQNNLFPTKYNAGYATNNGIVPVTLLNGSALQINGAPTGDSANPAPLVRGNATKIMNPDFNIGVGYRVNDWLRVEADYAFFRGPGYSASTQIYCPGQVSAVQNYYPQTANGQTTYQPSYVGYTYDWSTCNGNLQMQQYNSMGLVSAFFDLGHWGIFSPYIGGGVGVNADTVTGSLNWVNTSTGQGYAGPQINGSAPGLWVYNTGIIDASGHTTYAPLVDTKGNPPAMEIGAQNWNRNINSTKFTFAAQIAAGVGVKISQSATLDIGYKGTTADVTGGMKAIRHAIDVGVRYNIN